MPIAARRALVAVLAVALSGLVATGSLAQDADDLSRARAQIDAIESELAAANAASDDARADLARARDALDRIEQVVNAVAQRVAEQEDEVDAARDDLDRLRAEEDETRRAIRAKAVGLYKRAGGGELTTLVDARDIESAMDRSAFLRLVDKLDRARLEDLDGAVRRRTAAAEVLAVEQASLDELLTAQEAVMARAEEARDSRALAAAVAEDEVDELEDDHEHLTDLEDEIEKAIAERAAAERAAAERAAAEEAAREQAATSSASASSAAASSTEPDEPDEPSGGDDTAAPPPPSSGGGYAWPLCGTVTSEFKWRWGRQHEGIDIDDDRTDRITAAQSGTVISAGYNSGGYGNLVLVQHADGVVTAYAHQRSIVVSAGQSVSRGQLLGYVGSTGNSTGPHLHFETRVGGSDPVNPRQFLSGSGC